MNKFVLSVGICGFILAAMAVYAQENSFPERFNFGDIFMKGDSSVHGSQVYHHAPRFLIIKGEDKDPLIQRILKLNKKNTFKCATQEGEGCGTCGARWCTLKTDSIQVGFINGGAHRAHIQTDNIEIFGGRMRIGMTWEDFLKVAGTDIKYPESEELSASLDEDGMSSVYFRFAKKILREVIYNVDIP